ncbi:MAG: carboxylating nicotinate-nucleotide diphosphorylase [Proteobacteria bacterium]|nr:carboxylating nicotinate-nucleotide diphosphorylase [Pseudomonadota bacterium]
MNAFSLSQLIQDELETDQFSQDVTGNLLPSAQNNVVQAFVFNKESGVFSGVSVLETFQTLFTGQVDFRWEVSEGVEISSGTQIVELTGPRNTLLALERTLLNFLGLTCGVASLTRAYLNAVKPHSVQILATRKTLPGLRALQLSAVQAGGGKIHRRSLSDGILIKENHIALESEVALLQKAHGARSPLHGIEIEVQNFDSLNNVLSSPYSPDVIMLDNFSAKDVQTAVALIRQKLPTCRIEASGGVDLQSVRALAETGIDYVSVGKLTHSAPVLNLSLDFRL